MTDPSLDSISSCKLKFESHLKGSVAENLKDNSLNNFETLEGKVNEVTWLTYPTMNGYGILESRVRLQSLILASAGWRGVSALSVVILVVELGFDFSFSK